MERNFHSRFKALRMEHGISQARLGIMFDVTQQTVNKWEHGLSEPTYDTLKKLAVFFSVSIDYLLGLSDKMSSDV